MFNYQRVLIILPERLGDALFHTPSIQLLRETRPDIRIGVLALSSLTAGMLANNPDIDTIHLASTKSATRTLARDYDVVLKLHDHAEARKYVAWLGIPMLTYTHVPHDLHRSQRSLYLIKDLLECDVPEKISGYRLFPTVGNTSAVEALLRRNNYQADRDILIGCHIGCHSIAKRGLKFWRPLTHPKVWPFENFVALDALLRERDARFRLVLTGSKTEQKMSARFKQLSPATIDLVDQTSVLDLAALNSFLTLFVSGDTGTLHVACSSEVAVLALFGPTSTVLTGLYPPKPGHRVLQAPATADIAVTEVLDTILNHPDIIEARGAANDGI